MLWWVLMKTHGYHLMGIEDGADAAGWWRSHHHHHPMPWKQLVLRCPKDLQQYLLVTLDSYLSCVGESTAEIIMASLTSQDDVSVRLLSIQPTNVQTPIPCIRPSKIWRVFSFKSLKMGV